MSQGHQDTSTETPPKTAIVGAGSIGAAFAVVFASAGRAVTLFDTQAGSLDKARSYIEDSLKGLRKQALLHEDVAVILPRISFTENLATAVENAEWVHECAPERAEIKAEIFRQLEELAPADAILASATSAIPASQFANGLQSRHRCLVAHPGNPPFLLRVLELVPAPFTSQETVARAKRFSSSVGLDPVLVRKEVEGFVFNRLQGALLREAYCLVRDGVASVEDIDTLVRKGLGLRWSVIGPFETADLNTRGGIASHAEKLGPAYARMGSERGQNDPWTAELVAQVSAERRALLPMDEWEQRVAWRDQMLMLRLADGSDG
ncbi:MAG: L-gulonate 3-dehydrogenase [Glaciecola sp.]|jgi:L-gulonate 3-dehydrogenase